MMNRLSVGVTLVSGGLLCLSVNAQAREFIGFSQPGLPDSWALQNYPTIQPNSTGTNSVYNFFELAYFSKSGFTGTTRDQFEYWVGADLGYANTKGAPGSSGFGMASPEIGIEYYYQVIQPTTPLGSPDYRSFWVSPAFDVNFPNGNTQSAGYGAGADQYSIQANVATFNRWGNVLFTFVPVEINYDFQNLNSSPVAGTPNAFFKGRNGLSLTVGDLALAYQLTPDLAVGVLQQFNMNNIADSNFVSSREGFVGPSLTYAGFRNVGLFFGATVQTDYYRDHTAHNTYIAAWISKTF
jgi:hypothetical protein